VDGTQPGPRADAQLLAQQVVDHPVDLERLRPATAAVQGEQVDLVQRLFEPVPLDEQRHLGRHLGVLAALQPQPQQLLDGDQPQPLQPEPLAFGRVAGNPGQRRARPEGQRLLQQLHGRRDLPALALQPGRFEQVGELDGVHREQLGVEHVTAGPGADHRVQPVRGQQPSDAGDIRPDDGLAGGRRVLAPQAVDHLADPYEAAAVGQQQHQDGLLLGRAEVQAGVTAGEAGRSEDGEPAGRRKHVPEGRFGRIRAASVG
jgi:hypothetical protein